jgi:Flp pilus assembly protein TadG
MKSSDHRQRGSVLVEASFLIAFLVALFFGAIDLGRAINTAICLQQAVYAGAIYGASGNSSDNVGMKTQATNDATNIPNFTVTDNGLYCTCVTGGTLQNCSGIGCGTPYEYVRVSASASVNTFFPYGIIPRTIPINASVSLRVQ